MSESDLSAELRRNAEATAESIREAARLEVDRLAAEADRKISRHRRRSQRFEERARRSEARAAIAAERHDAMRAVLLAKTGVVDRVLEAAKALLPAASKGEAYLSTLASRLAEALQFVDGDDVRVRCSEALVSHVRGALPEQRGVAVEPDSQVRSGFMLASKNGSVTVDERLETRLARVKNELAIEIHAQLEDV